LPEGPRQDVKHVAILALCLPHFLEDVQAQIAAPAEQKRDLTEYVGTLAALKNTYSGRRFEAEHPGVVGCAELIPLSCRRLPFAKDMRQSLRELGAERSP